MGLAKRSISSVIWHIPTTIIQIIVQFLRSVLLARWLSVQDFGVYALASAVVVLSASIVNFGMNSAFLYRTEETMDESKAAAVHFTLRLLFTTGWLLIYTIIVVFIVDDHLQLALLVVGYTFLLQRIADTPLLILYRRVVHSRVSIIQLLSTAVSTPIMLYLGSSGFGVWALLSSNIINMAVTILGLCIWKPFWKPKFSLDRNIVRYFFSFGAKVYPTIMLSEALDRLDDVWVGFFLGKIQMGFYSRAYRFASFPRRLIASPVSTVEGGTYAEVKENREKLSQTFNTIVGVLIRSGLLISGALWLVAPEFIRLLLGEKWLPMVNTFRLMLVFSILDPVKISFASLFVHAAGKPEVVLKVRIIQLIIMVIGLFTLGSIFGIDGVAIAVDIMLLAGIGIYLYYLLRYVNFSIKKLFIQPGVIMLLSLLLGRLAIELPFIPRSDWSTGTVKLFVFCIAYLFMVLCFERKEWLNLASFMWNRMFTKDLDPVKSYK